VRDCQARGAAVVVVVGSGGRAVDVVVDGLRVVGGDEVVGEDELGETVGMTPEGGGLSELDVVVAASLDAVDDVETMVGPPRVAGVGRGGVVGSAAADGERPGAAGAARLGADSWSRGTWRATSTMTPATSRTSRALRTRSCRSVKRVVTPRYRDAGSWRRLGIPQVSPSTPVNP